MVIMFLQAVDINGQYEFDKGVCLPAEECGDYIAIRLPDGCTTLAPKSEIGDTFEIIY